LAVVFGAGPGLGGAVARRFAKEGYSVALLTRNVDTTKPLAEAINAEKGGRAYSFSVDASDQQSVSTGFKSIRDQLGHVDVLVYNVAAFGMGSILDIKPEDFEKSWRALCLGAFLASKEVLPSMVEKKKGTILLTGATGARRGAAKFSIFSVSKFGLKALAESMARELQPQGIHVAHVVVDGRIGEEGTSLHPDAIADTYYYLHTQDKSAWTFELELRPFVEKW